MEVTDHTGELHGQPVFWRSAPTPTPGAAPPLYVHGVPTSSDDWLPFLRETGGLAPDLLGFGRSGKGGQNDYSIDGIAAFVEQFLELVGVERVKLVVHDWGSAALAWAIANPERVEKLVIVDAVPLLPGYRWHRVARLWRAPGIGEMAMGLTFKLTLKRALRSAFAGPVPTEFTSAAWRHFDQGTQRAILRLYRSAPETRLAEAGRELSRVARADIGSLGRARPLHPASLRGRLRSEDPGSRVEHVTDAGHWPWVDRADLIATIATFLRDN